MGFWDSMIIGEFVVMVATAAYFLTKAIVEPVARHFQRRAIDRLAEVDPEGAERLRRQ